MRCELKRRKLRPWTRGCLLGSGISLTIFCLYIGLVLFDKNPITQWEFKLRAPPNLRLEYPISDNSTKVIILSYMRSGTTMMGKLFDMDDSALYIFEPMWYLCIVASPSFRLIRYLNGTRRYAPPSCNDLGLTETESFLNCRISDICTGTLAQVWMQLAKKTNTFNRCGLEPRCITDFTKECQKSRIRVVKVIRLSISAIIPLLIKDPHLKVIHLVRDPRGQIQSRIPMKEYYYYSPIITGANICGDMLRNVRTFRQAASYFSKQLLQVRYEDFAADPVEYTEKIYDFLGFPAPIEVQKWVMENTQASSDDGILGTTRADSKLTSHKWRQNISWELMMEMDEVCSGVYNELGYLTTKSEKVLRNLSIPLIRDEDNYL